MIDLKKQPIGIFDSGIGGTSVWKEVSKILPNENTIYLADSKNAPYGYKSKQEIIDLSVKNTEYLISIGCKLIIVACNTATTNAIGFLRKKYNIPFIGIEPAIKPAALKTKTNVIGILATKGTLNSKLFANTSSKINQNIKKIEIIGKDLVTLIEDGKLESDVTYKLVESYINPLLKQNADCLVLGCTHYPYLIPIIRRIVGDKMQIIDSGKAVAKQTKAVLSKNHLINPSNTRGENIFLVNKNNTPISKLLIDSIKNINIKRINF